MTGLTEVNKIYPNGLQHWLAVDLDRLAANLRAVRSYVGEGVGIIAVVKNDAYGFGALPCAAAFVAAGVDMLAVTTPEEAVELRLGGIEAPILVFLPVQEYEVELYVRYRLTATVDSLRAAKCLRGSGVECHLKVNTGMGRFGCDMDELAEILAEFSDFGSESGTPRLTGVYSHLATAPEKDERYARRQIAAFAAVREQVNAAGFGGVMFHLANSAGMLRFPEIYSDTKSDTKADIKADIKSEIKSEIKNMAVRVGSILYGQLPMSVAYGLVMQDPLEMCARVAAIRHLKKGESVGYGCEFTADSDRDVAVIPWGYGDGYGISVEARVPHIGDAYRNFVRTAVKLLSGRLRRGVMYRGEFLPILGRVAMQSMMVDVTGRDIAVGDVVNLNQRKVTTSARLPRVYYRGGGICEVRSLTVPMAPYSDINSDIKSDKINSDNISE